MNKSRAAYFLRVIVSLLTKCSSSVMAYVAGECSCSSLSVPFQPLCRDTSLGWHAHASSCSWVLLLPYYTLNPVQAACQSLRDCLVGIGCTYNDGMAKSDILNDSPGSSASLQLCRTRCRNPGDLFCFLNFKTVCIHPTQLLFSPTLPVPTRFCMTDLQHDCRKAYIVNMVQK